MNQEERAENLGRILWAEIDDPALGVLDVQKCLGLIKDGADVNIASSDILEKTALMLLMNHDFQPSLLTALIDSGANIHARDKDGYTPLMYAAARRNKHGINALIHYGADIEAKNNSNETATMIAHRLGNHGIADLIQKTYEAHITETFQTAADKGTPRPRRILRRPKP